MNLVIDRGAVNLELLDLEIRSNLGEQFRGVSFNGERVTLYLSDDATDEQVAAAVRLAEAHDPSLLTPYQQETADRAARLEELRDQNIQPLDLSLYTEADSDLRRLAEKIAWLELEIVARW